MKRYIEHIQDTHTPHERREVAMRIAVIVTAVLFVGWLATLGLRVGGGIPNVAEEANTHNSASVLEAVQENAPRQN